MRRNEGNWERQREMLINRGLLSKDGDSRRARARTCTSCGGYVMAGFDHDRVAMDAVCDPTPINAIGEAMALITGRQTYSLRWTGGRYQLDHRDQWRITARPAGSCAEEEILAEHKCNMPMDNRFHQLGRIPVGPRTKEQTSDDTPPF